MRQHPYGAEVPFSPSLGAARLGGCGFLHFHSGSPADYWFLLFALKDKDGARRSPCLCTQRPVIRAPICTQRPVENWEFHSCT